MKDPLAFRRPEHIYAILGHVYDATDPYPWTELVNAVENPDTTRRTIEAIIYDLTAIGALHRIGHPRQGRRPDTRALKPTLLGRAWLRQEHHPLPGHHQDDDDLEAANLDAITEAYEKGRATAADAFLSQDDDDGPR